MPTARWLPYRLVMAAGLVAGAPFLLARRRGLAGEILAGRLVRPAPDPFPGRPLWIHAVSVGEVGVAATLVRALPAELPLLVTTVTPTGQARAHTLFKDRARVAYLPLDLEGPVDRFLAAVEPRALLLTEGDYWPLLLAHLARRDVPVAVINGRVSDRSFPRLAGLARRLPRAVGLFFGPVARFGMQTAADRDRLLALGVPAEKVSVTGNLKYETLLPKPLAELEREITALAAGRPILVAGSTMAGEEEAVLTAFQAASTSTPSLLILAPRHPERFAEVERLLARRGMPYLRRSSLPASATKIDVLLLDTVGELASLYALARGAFIGGTLAPTGGHNPLEAARFGVPVAVGPSMENFREMAEMFDARGAWARVADASALGATWGRALSEPGWAQELGGRGREVVEANRGALERTLALIAPWCSPGAGGGG